VRILQQIRSALSLLLTLFVFVPGGLYLYLILIPAIAVFPARATAWQAAFIKGMAHSLLFGLRLGGASFHRTGIIPTGGPCLVVGNHQSLVDPAVLITMCEPSIPAFVARSRYAKVPVVGKSMEWANCPVIDPTRDARGAVVAIAAAAARLEHGLLIFPEGHRSLDGELRPFRTSGLIAILTTRRVPVYLAVSDGLWVNRRLVDVVFNVHKMRGVTEVLGPFAPPEDPAAIPTFIDGLRDTMVGHLAQMRQRNERAA
jgi:1-acyl-sn-glycerol-3-phosphate acyltransferase